MEGIYVDHAATSPVHPKVVETMLPYLTDYFGNPSSIHQYGRKSRHALDEARAVLANSIQASSNEIMFTSGGTEADNTAVIGYALSQSHKGKHIITTAIEHHAILHTCQSLEDLGFDVTYLPVGEDGQVNIDDVKNSVRADTILATVMFGNNEVGTLQPISEIGAFLREQGIVFHTDAVQAYGMVDINVEDLPIDMLSVSAHKLNGPKGVGFLYIKEGITIKPHLYGGEQERKRRAGTENVAAIVGFAEAVKYSIETMAERRELYGQFRKTMIDIFEEEELDFTLNGHQDHVSPHILNVSFYGVNIESLLVNLDLAGIAASSGSACTAGSLEPSHVLAEMFADKARVLSAIRFSFGYGNTEEEIEKVARETAKIVKRIKTNQ